MEGEWPLGKAALKSVLESAVEKAMQDGDRAAAHRRLTEVVRKQKEAAPDSPLHAYALFCFAVLASQLGDLQQAVALLEEACAMPVPDDEKKKENQKDRLTFLMNLGDTLTATGKLERAEEVLLDGLRGRVEFYGDGHPGVAFGLHSLAECLYAQGKAAEAYSAVHSAFEINASAGQPQVVDNLSLRAFCSAAVDSDKDPFPDWGRCPAALNEAIVEKCCTAGAGYVKERKEAAPSSIAVLKRLGERLSSAGLGGEGGAPLKLRLGVANQLFNVAQIVKDAQTSLEACKRCLELAKEEGVPYTIVHAHMGLAVALEGVGAGWDAVNKEYDLAIAVAEEAGQDELVAKVLRNKALGYSQAGETEKAQGVFEEAMAKAAETGDVMAEAPVNLAYGIFLQHQKIDLDKAKELLTKAVKDLPPGSDRYCALSHLTAIDSEGACGCNKESSVTALSTMLDTIVRRDLKIEDLLESVGYVENEDTLDLNVRLKRKPTPEESEELERVIRLAQVELEANMAHQ